MSWLGLFLLFFHLTAGSGLSFSSASADEVNLAQLTQICSDHDAGQSPLDLPGERQDQHGLHCVFCLPFWHGGVTLPPSQLLIVQEPRKRGSTHFVQDTDRLWHERYLSSAYPRAPPVLS